MQTLLEGKDKSFLEFHESQLKAAGFPSQLIGSLAEKLRKEIFDFSDYFQVQDNQNEDSFQAVALKKIPAASNVFIVEHQLVFKSDELRNLLLEDSDLVQRLKYHLQYFGDKKKIPGLEEAVHKYKGVEEYDSLEIVDPSTYKIPKNTVSVSFFDNKIESLELVKLMIKEIPTLKSLFLNYNPVCESPNFKKTIEEEFPQIELLNSKLTQNSGKIEKDTLYVGSNDYRFVC